MDEPTEPASETDPWRFLDADAAEAGVVGDAADTAEAGGGTAAADVGHEGSSRQRLVAIVLLVVAAATVICAAVIAQRRSVVPLPAVIASVDATITAPSLTIDTQPVRRSVAPYEGLGTWVDGFDYSLPYTGPNPPVVPGDLAAMAEVGVKTLYLQAARVSGRSPDVLEDRFTLAQFLQEAERQNIAVVAWFLPKWGDGSDDADRLRAIAEFSALGRSFDGIAMDIEWTADELDPLERGRRLVALSQQLRDDNPDATLGAIVLPPVLTDVVNDQFWPDFPWTDIAPLYDVWLPMSYWSFRSAEYASGYTYNNESTIRLRDHLGDPDAVVHAIGGIGGVDGVDDPIDPEEPLASIDEFDDFARSVEETGAVGASVYDWVTLEPAVRDRLAELFGPSPGE